MTKHPLQFLPAKKNQAIAARRMLPHTMKYSLILLLVFGVQLLFGQDLESGIEALEEAGEGIADYFEPIETIVYTLAGIMALFGIFKVYSKWQGGDANVMSAAVGWLASVLFLIIAITIIKSFFNI